MNNQTLKQCLAEAIGTFALIFIGVGAIYNHSIHQTGMANVGLLPVALAHGLAIAVMVSATAGISGGHLNPAVTFGLLLGGQIAPQRAFLYIVSQLAGATAAGYACMALLRHEITRGAVDYIKGSALPAKFIVFDGTPALAADVSFLQGIGIEAVVTFFLVFVVFGSAVDPRAPKIGGLAIGLTVTMGILFAGPLTGGAINPARAFGPAIAGGQWANHLVYWIGPLLGGGLAGLLYGRFLIKDSSK
jgi:MIP family channel proteins